MNTKLASAVLGGCAALSLSSVALAQRSVSYSGDGRPSRIFRPVSGLNGNDSKFLKDAAVAHIFEIQTSKIAEDHANSPFTKQYAKEMSADHAASLEELKKIASDKGVELPSDLPIPEQRTVNYLSRLNGDDFDSAYRRTQIGHHGEASIKFKDEIDNGRDEDVKNYAVKTLPAVTMHYKLAKIQRTMMGPTKYDHGI